MASGWPRQLVGSTVWETAGAAQVPTARAASQVSPGGGYKPTKAPQAGLLAMQADAAVP